MPSEQDNEKSSESSYLFRAFGSLILVGIISNLWATSIQPFTMVDSFWSTKETPIVWVSQGWPLFIWGFLATLILWSFRTQKKISTDEESKLLWGGFAISVWAGVVEEICFRWLIFLNCLWCAKLGNLILCGFPEWLYMHIFGPIANWTTFGLMQEYLYHPASWAVGASILSANAAFRDGHKYQGPFGIINSWYIGMFFFWAMFKYGLIASILLHFLYDFLIFTTVYAAYVLRRKVAQ